MSRLRVFSDSSFPHSYDQSYTINGAPQSWAVPIVVADTSHKYMRDVVTDNFIARRARGEIFNNEMLFVEKIVGRKPSAVSNVGSQGHVGTLQYLAPEGGMPSSVESAVILYLEDFESSRDTAVTNAWADVDVSELNTLASLGELPETVAWMVSILTRFNKLLFIFRRKQLLIYAKRLRGRDLVDAVSNFWLEMRYAVRPLLFEMDSAVKALNTILEKCTRRTARGFAGSKTPTLSNASYDQILDPGYWGIRYSVSSSIARNYRAGVLYAINDNVNGMKEIWGLNQPIEAIWELIPFSFIIDWFFNIGDVVASIFASSALTPLASWVVEEHVITYEYEATELIILQYRTTYDVSYTLDDPGYFRGSIVIRRRLVSPARSYMPSLRINLDPAKILDLATIGRAIFQSIAHRR